MKVDIFVFLAIVSVIVGLIAWGHDEPTCEDQGGVLVQSNFGFVCEVRK